MTRGVGYSKANGESCYQWRQRAKEESEKGLSRERVELCLREASARAHYLFEFLECARAWVELAHGGEEAKACLVRAEEEAARAGEVTKCVEAWRDLLGEDEALKCITRITARAQDAATLVACSKVWHSVLANDNKAIECLQRAEPMASVDDLLECAQLYAHGHKDVERARRLIESAEGQAEACHEPLQCARAWIEVVRDEPRARGCLERATNAAITGYDFVVCAKAWHALFGDDTKARHCLNRAQTDPQDFCACVGTWKEIFGAPEAKQLLVAYEYEAHDIRTRLQCAEARYQIFKEADQAQVLMKSAIAMATTAADLLACATTAQTIVSDPREIEYVLDRASTLSDEPVDLVACARQWMAIPNKSEQAHQCLQRAAKREPICYVVIDIVRLWCDIAPTDPVPEALLHRTSAAATDAIELIQYANAWAEVFKRSKETKVCLLKAFNASSALDSRIACAHAADRTGHRELAQQFMQDTEAQARQSTTPRGILAVAKAWAQLAERDKACELVAEACNGAGNVHEQLECAAALRTINGPAGDIQRHIEAAADCASYPFEWALCAQAAHLLLHDAKLARKNMCRAERESTLSYHHAYCARTWQQINGRQEAIQRCASRVSQTLSSAK